MSFCGAISGQLSRGIQGRSQGSRARGAAESIGCGLSRVTNEATTDMANTPKKMKDPTEAALSAIQDALQVRDEDKPISTPSSSGFSDPDAPDGSWLGLRSKSASRSSSKSSSKTDIFDDDLRRDDDNSSLRH